MKLGVQKMAGTLPKQCDRENGVCWCASQCGHQQPGTYFEGVLNCGKWTKTKWATSVLLTIWKRLPGFVSLKKLTTN